MTQDTNTCNEPDCKSAIYVHLNGRDGGYCYDHRAKGFAWNRRTA